MKRTSRGFSLLEVLIAMLVLSFGLLGLAALQAYSVKANQSAHLRSQATALAGMILDNIRSNRSEILGYYSNEYVDMACDDDPEDSPLAAADLSTWRQQIACQLPQGRGAVAPISGTEVAVCIRWSDQRWIEGGTAEGRCTADAVTYGAGLAVGGTGAGVDGEFSVFVVSTRL